MKKLRQWKAISLACAALLALCGCGGDSLGRQAVSGAITLDGAPLSHGNIRFKPQQAESPMTAGAVISAGKFHIDRERGLPPGLYKVVISCPKLSDGVDQAADTGGLAEELVPARYNSETTLEATITADGGNEFKFDMLTEQPAA